MMNDNGAVDQFQNEQIMYNQQLPQPDMLIEYDDYGESDLPTGHEIDFFIREELALVLEKA